MTRKEKRLAKKEPKAEEVFKNEIPFSPNLSFNGDKSMWIRILGNVAEQQNASILSWNDELEKFDTYSQELNTLLYRRARLVAFKYKGKLRILPYSMNGNLNDRAKPVFVQPIPLTSNIQDILVQDSEEEINEEVNFEDNKSQKRDSTVDFENDKNNGINFEYPTYKVGKNCVILYDFAEINEKIGTRFSNDRAFNNAIADILSAIQLNVQTAKKKIVIYADDDEQAKGMEEVLKKSLENHNPFVVLVRNGIKQDNELFNNENFIADEYFFAIKNLIALKDMSNGILNGGIGNEKGERMITAELTGIEYRTELIKETRISLAKLFAKQVNKMFNTNLTVEYFKGESKNESIHNKNNFTISSSESS